MLLTIGFWSFSSKFVDLAKNKRELWLRFWQKKDFITVVTDKRQDFYGIIKVKDKSISQNKILFSILANLLGIKFLEL